MIWYIHKFKKHCSKGHKYLPHLHNHNQKYIHHILHIMIIITTITQYLSYTQAYGHALLVIEVFSWVFPFWNFPNSRLVFYSASSSHPHRKNLLIYLFSTNCPTKRIPEFSKMILGGLKINRQHLIDLATESSVLLMSHKTHRLIFYFQISRKFYLIHEGT